MFVEVLTFAWFVGIDVGPTIIVKWIAQQWRAKKLCYSALTHTSVQLMDVLTRDNVTLLDVYPV